ncbi:hypothetical protein BPO_1354 [Bergeyella porcorum]|uniref:Uncharacterized protein n=1 Tax=Bergeyella porcorum TaxID=1735111 RepID=A0AAU0F7N6_9FLAO
MENGGRHHYEFCSERGFVGTMAILYGLDEELDPESEEGETTNSE